MKTLTILRLIRLLLICSFTSLLSCTTRSQPGGKPAKEGRLRHLLRFYDEKRDTGLVLFIDMWYKDSMVVQKITGRHADTRNDKTTITYPLQKYICMYLPTMTAYEYHTFTDTAKPYHQYHLTDSSRGGWLFYADHHPRINDTLRWLPDTTMEGITYRRAAFEYIYPPDYKRKMTGFFRCDITDTLFMLEREISRRAGCPMMIMHDYGNNRPDYYAAISLHFTADSLLVEERKVLEAWKQNGKSGF